MSRIRHYLVPLTDQRLRVIGACRIPHCFRLLLKQGKRPIDTKSLSTVAAGVAEIRVHDEGNNQYRVIYIAKIAGSVHVLHAFQKKTRRTRQSDLDIARERLKELRQELRNEKSRRK